MKFHKSMFNHGLYLPSFSTSCPNDLCSSASVLLDDSLDTSSQEMSFSSCKRIYYSSIPFHTQYHSSLNTPTRVLQNHSKIHSISNRTSSLTSDQFHDSSYTNRKLASSEKSYVKLASLDASSSQNYVSKSFFSIDEIKIKCNLKRIIMETLITNSPNILNDLLVNPSFKEEFEKYQKILLENKSIHNSANFSDAKFSNIQPSSQEPNLGKSYSLDDQISSSTNRRENLELNEESSGRHSQSEVSDWCSSENMEVRSIVALCCRCNTKCQTLGTLLDHSYLHDLHQKHCLWKKCFECDISFESDELFKDHLLSKYHILRLEDVRVLPKYLWRLIFELEFENRLFEVIDLSSEKSAFDSYHRLGKIFFRIQKSHVTELKKAYNEAFNYLKEDLSEKIFNQFKEFDLSDVKMMRVSSSDFEDFSSTSF